MAKTSVPLDRSPGVQCILYSFDSKYKLVISILRDRVLSLIYQQIKCSISLVNQYFSLVCNPA